MAVVFIGQLVLPFGASVAASETPERVSAPEFPAGLTWLNVDRPLRLSHELRGRIAVLEFWNSGAISCDEAHEEIARLRERFADDPVVFVGVHAAKFPAERPAANVANAVARLGITYPVVVDERAEIFNAYGVRGWPHFTVIGPDGAVVGYTTGGDAFDVLEAAIEQALEEAREGGSLASEGLTFSVPPVQRRGLWFPGKVAAAAPREGREGLLFLADSGNNRVVIATYPDAEGVSRVVRVVGDGEPGMVDGPAASSRLREPQGLAFDEESRTLYIADRRNHAIRAYSLDQDRLVTLVGNGGRSFDRRGGKAGSEQGLHSPWDVALSPDGATLYVALAGLHQVWSVDVRTARATRLAGSGRLNAIDGPLDAAAMAQPSGLAISRDGRSIYVAEAESSSVRVIDLEAGVVRTVVGHAAADPLENGLAAFGDVDGAFPDARLQHCMGVAMTASERGDELLVADTYNNRVRIVSADAQRIGPWREISGLDQPGGIAACADGRLFVADTNNHRVLMVEPDGRTVEVRLDQPSLTSGSGR